MALFITMLDMFVGCNQLQYLDASFTNLAGPGEEGLQSVFKKATSLSMLNLSGISFFTLPVTLEFAVDFFYKMRILNLFLVGIDFGLEAITPQGWRSNLF